MNIFDWMREDGRYVMPWRKCSFCRRRFSTRRRVFSDFCSHECVEMVAFYRKHPEMRHISNAAMRYSILGDESSRIDLEWFFLKREEPIHG